MLSLLILLSTVAMSALPAQAVDWTAPSELMKELHVYQAILAATLGIQLWEHLGTLRFEIDVYRGALPWRHGMLVYLLVRYSTWASLIATAANIYSTGGAGCEAALVILLVFFSLSTLGTTLIFVLRTVAIFAKRLWVIYLLGTLWLIQAGLHLTSATRIRSTRLNGLCVTYFTEPEWEFNIAFLAVLILDLTTFTLSTWRLYDAKQKGLGKILFAQSVMYIAISSVLNGLCISFLYASLNGIMGYMLGSFTMTVSGILACRCFRDLQIVVCKATGQYNSTITEERATSSGKSRKEGPNTVPPVASRALIPLLTFRHHVREDDIQIEPNGLIEPAKKASEGSFVRTSIGSDSPRDGHPGSGRALARADNDGALDGKSNAVANETGMKTTSTVQTTLTSIPPATLKSQRPSRRFPPSDWLNKSGFADPPKDYRWNKQTCTLESSLIMNSFLLSQNGGPMHTSITSPGGRDEAAQRGHAGKKSSLGRSTGFHGFSLREEEGDRQRQGSHVDIELTQPSASPGPGQQGQDADGGSQQVGKLAFQMFVPADPRIRVTCSRVAVDRSTTSDNESPQAPSHLGRPQDTMLNGAGSLPVLGPDGRHEDALDTSTLVGSNASVAGGKSPARS